MNRQQETLNRLSITAHGCIVYDAGEGWTFTAFLDEINEAHALDVTVGAHPYAAITLSHDEDSAVPKAGPLAVESFEDDAPALADWADWVDDVMSWAMSQPSDDLGCLIIEAMRRTGRVHEADEALALDLNAAA